MKVCFPVVEDRGIESSVFGHFGSAPGFVVVDTETEAIQSFANIDQHHAHGTCNPLKAIGGVNVDAIVVGDIGAGALARLRNANIRVYLATAQTVRENLEPLLRGEFRELVQHVCGGDGHGHGCSH